mgnify:CR=1 FL=1
MILLNTVISKTLKQNYKDAVNLIVDIINIKIMAMNTGNEDQVSKAIEQETSKIPSVVFLGAAMAVMGISAALKCARGKDDENDLFIGQWAAPILLLGIYNKIVKSSGHD